MEFNNSPNGIFNDHPPTPQPSVPSPMSSPRSSHLGSPQSSASTQPSLYSLSSPPPSFPTLQLHQIGLRTEPQGPMPRKTIAVTKANQRFLINIEHGQAALAGATISTEQPSSSSRRTPSRKTPLIAAPVTPCQEDEIQFVVDKGPPAAGGRGRGRKEGPKEEAERIAKTRENERRRRAQQKDSAERLRNLVPELRPDAADGKSRKAGEGIVMQKSADYIEQLQKELADLRKETEAKEKRFDELEDVFIKNIYRHTTVWRAFTQQFYTRILAERNRREGSDPAQVNREIRSEFLKRKEQLLTQAPLWSPHLKTSIQTVQELNNGLPRDDGVFTLPVPSHLFKQKPPNQANSGQAVVPAQPSQTQQQSTVMVVSQQQSNVMVVSQQQMSVHGQQPPAPSAPNPTLNQQRPLAIQHQGAQRAISLPGRFVALASNTVPAQPQQQVIVNAQYKNVSGATIVRPLGAASDSLVQLLPNQAASSGGKTRIPAPSLPQQGQQPKPLPKALKLGNETFYLFVHDVHGPGYARITPDGLQYKSVADICQYGRAQAMERKAEKITAQMGAVTISQPPLPPIPGPSTQPPVQMDLSRLKQEPEDPSHENSPTGEQPQAGSNAMDVREQTGSEEMEVERQTCAPAEPSQNLPIVLIPRDSKEDVQDEIVPNLRDIKKEVPDEIVPNLRDIKEEVPDDFEDGDQDDHNQYGMDHTVNMASEQIVFNFHHEQGPAIGTSSGAEGGPLLPPPPPEEFPTEFGFRVPIGVRVPRPPDNDIGPRPAFTRRRDDDDNNDRPDHDHGAGGVAMSEPQPSTSAGASRKSVRNGDLEYTVWQMEQDDKLFTQGIFRYDFMSRFGKTHEEYDKKLDAIRKIAEQIAETVRAEREAADKEEAERRQLQQQAANSGRKRRKNNNSKSDKFYGYDYDSDELE